MKTFYTTVGEAIPTKEKDKLNQLSDLIKKLEEIKTDEQEEENKERKKTQEEIKKLIIKPKSSEQKASQISKLVATEVKHIALPGYDYLENQKQESQIGRGLNKAAITPESIAKQEVIQNILLNHYELQESQIIVLTERIKQEHLNHKYFAYYAEIKETGILIVLNDQYGQAARIKKVESEEDAETQLAILIGMLENSDKRTMDEIQGFKAFKNTYSSITELENLYKLKIEEELNSKEEEINLSESAEKIWKGINLPATIHYNGRHKKEIKTIQDFFELDFTPIVKGEIGKTPVREIINAILSKVEGYKKITSHAAYEKGKENKTRVENAIAELEELVKNGDLGKEAKVEYENLLKIETAKKIWKGINLPATIHYNGRHKKEIKTIQDFLKLSFSVIVNGKIGNTLVRDIINAMLRLEGDKKITCHCKKKKGDANKTRVKSAIEAIKKLAEKGKLGDKAKTEYEKYLKENPEAEEEEINLSESAEKIWKEINLPATILYKRQKKEIKTIQDFLKLLFTVIVQGKIGNTLVRDIINAMLKLEGDKKITCHTSGKKQLEANKTRVDSAIAKLEELVKNGDLGKEAKEEYEKIETAEDIWKGIKLPATILYKRQKKEIKTIQDFLKLPFSEIVQGKIGNTLIRDIINAMLRLEGEEKITSHAAGKKNEKKVKANKTRVEKAIEEIKKLAENGKLGEKAQEEYEKYLKENLESNKKRINLSGTEKEIWERINLPATILYKNGRHKIEIKTIQDFLQLHFNGIVRGKIGNTLVRDIINAMLGLEGEEKITSHASGKKIKKEVDANKTRVKSAIEAIKKLAEEGKLGDKAKTEIQPLVEAEKIQNEINKEIKKI